MGNNTRLPREADYAELPEGVFEEAPQLEQLSRYVAEKLLEVNEEPKIFAREDILGNIEIWERDKLMMLHKLQKGCDRLGLHKAESFFTKEEKKMLGVSRSVKGFQQKILRTTLSGKTSMEDDGKKKKSWIGWG